MTAAALLVPLWLLAGCADDKYELVDEGEDTAVDTAATDTSGGPDGPGGPGDSGGPGDGDTGCDEQTWYPDEDSDGYGDDVRAYESCEGQEGWIGQGGDCDDGDASIHPGADEEVCDGVDNDCDPGTEDFAPGIVAPIIDAVVMSNGGVQDFSGELYPTVLLDFILSDGDGDMGEVTLHTWLDPIVDGVVDTSAPSTYTSELSVGGDLCGYYAVTASLYLSVGTTIPYDTLYEFGAIVEDVSGNQSNTYVVSGYTPKSDGSDGG